MTTNWKEELQIDVLEDYLMTASNKYLYDLNNGQYEEDMRSHLDKLHNFITTLLEKQREEYVEMIDKKKEKAKKYKLQHNEYSQTHHYMRGQEEICEDIINLIKSHDKTS